MTNPEPSFNFSFLSSKKGFSNFGKILIGIILILFLLVLSPILFNTNLTSGFPSWFLPLLILGFGLGLAYTITR